MAITDTQDFFVAVFILDFDVVHFITLSTDCHPVIGFVTVEADRSFGRTVALIPAMLWIFATILATILFVTFTHVLIISERRFTFVVGFFFID